MSNVPRDRSLLHLYEAPDVAGLRERLGRHLADRGFWCVGECINSEQVTDAYTDIARFLWDTLPDRVGDRRDDLVRALNEAGLPEGVEEENRRLRWAAAQRRPYLQMSGEAAEFRAHHNIRRAVEAFGLCAPNTLVVPVPDGGAGRRRLWAFAEADDALENAQEAAGLMTAYNHMRQLLPAGGTRSWSVPTGAGYAVPSRPRRDPMRDPAPTRRIDGPVFSQRRATRARAVRAYIEDTLNDPELGVDQLCRVFGLSRRTVYRIFADDRGVARYLTERRLVRAFADLSASQPASGLVLAVAERYGFVSQSHFSRQFRKRFSIAPQDSVGLDAARPAATPREEGVMAGDGRDRSPNDRASGSA